MFCWELAMLHLVAADGFLERGFHHIPYSQSFYAGEDAYLLDQLAADDGTQTLFMALLFLLSLLGTIRDSTLSLPVALFRLWRSVFFL